MSKSSPPLNPAGKYEPATDYSKAEAQQYIQSIADFPDQLREVVASLDARQLDAVYRNWTIRQIVHHLADSHLNCYVRFKWALTEDEPVIKSYDETQWSELPDAKQAGIESSLTLLRGLHQRWSQLMTRMTDDQWRRGFCHPGLNRVIPLAEALPMYEWHSRHHLAQIEWVIHQRGL